MTEATPAGLPPSRMASTPVFLATFAAILITIVGVLFVDLFLAAIDRRESAAHAAAEYQDGLDLLRRGRAGDAVDRFETAVSIDRSSVPYTLALAEAMLADGRTTDAEATLRDLLGRAENDGAVNLAMAHVMEREGRIAEAKAFFHRAIFGHWGADSVTREQQARLELIDLLVQRGSSHELLAELLPLEAVPPESAALATRVGQWFILAGTPARAANVFRSVLRRNPSDAEAWAGMGDAQLALGNYRTARLDFGEAARLRPGDSTLAVRLAIADTALALDPTLRGLGPQERYARSRTILQRAVAAVSACGGAMTAQADTARGMLLHPTPPAAQDTTADAMLAKAADLWAARPPVCPDLGGEALRMVLARVRSLDR